MNPQNRNFVIALILGAIIIVVGTIGYMAIEGWSLLDSFYMVVITITTIGFGEINPLSQTGRLFTLIIAIFGVATAAYVLGQLTRAIVEGSLNKVLGRRMLEAQIRKMRNHYVLCGYGRIGRMVSQQIMGRGLPLVVVENHTEVMDQLERDGVPFLRGDASDEERLMAAGIKEARGLISAVSSDADNLYIVLTARSLNPNLFILARASEERSIKKLKGAGADRVVSPYFIGARKMAQTILRPAVADFLESTVHGEGEEDHFTLAMEEILVTPSSKINNVTLMESGIRRELDLIVIAIKKSGGQMHFNPSATTTIEIGDTLIAVGLRENMDRLAKLLGAFGLEAPAYHNNKSEE